MNPIEQFDKEREERVNSNAQNKGLKDLASKFLEASIQPKYSYNFTWMGRPIIQYPQDIIVMQELIWETRPDVIIETGIAHGGSLIFYASLLELLNNGKIIGIDIDIRKHNRDEIESHPMYKRISLIEGSSISDAVVQQVKEHVKPENKVMVILDSNHTHEHVRTELELYSKFVTPNCYVVVFDTVIEFLPGGFPDRPWDTGNNPYTAVQDFLKGNDQFVLDPYYENKALITVAPGGFLKRVR